MKKLLLLSLLIIPSIIGCSSKSEHEKAADAFKKYGTKQESKLGRNVYNYSFDDIYTANSEYSGGCSFYYNTKRDTFTLSCYFDSYTSSGTTSGYVYTDFKWGDYKTSIHYFDLILYNSSDEPIHFYCKYEFFITGIDKDKLSSLFWYNAVYSEQPKGKQYEEAESGYKLLTQAFNYGKTIVDKCKLSKFY